MRRAVTLLAATLAAATALTGCVGSGGSYTFTGIFASGQNLFPGAAVQVLGLAEGTVTSVHAVGRHVVVDMSLPDSVTVPAGVKAEVVAPELLGQRSVDLAPGYTGGPRLAPGAVIPESRTSVPVGINTILHEVTNYLQDLQPANVHDAVANLARDLQGQGQALGQLITNAAGTISLLAQKGNQLGQLNGTLARLTGALDSRTTQIQTLITDYDSVAGVVAQDQAQLNGAISALSQATTQLAGVLDPNLGNLESDLNTLTTVGRTLDRNLSSIDLGLSSSVSLFAGAGRAYDPTYHWLTLNNQAPSGLASGVLAADLRDRLAGICRRLLAHHSQGLSSQEVSTLKTCGNPDSGFFDGVLGLVPGALAQSGAAPTTGPTTGPTSASTTESVYSSALSLIPGLSANQRRSLAAIPVQDHPGSVPVPSGPTPPGSGPTQPEQLVGALAPPPVVSHPTALGHLLHPLSALWHALGRLL